MSGDQQKSEKKPDLVLLDEDDEIKEFPEELLQKIQEDWTRTDEDQTDKLVDNCDDDNVEGDFSKQLRNELEKHGLWVDNWDDDNVEDDFSKQLRNEFEKQGQGHKSPELMQQ